MPQENTELVQANVDALGPVYEQWGRGNWRPQFISSQGPGDGVSLDSVDVGEVVESA